VAHWDGPLMMLLKASNTKNAQHYPHRIRRQEMYAAANVAMAKRHRYIATKNYRWGIHHAEK
jgi:hypothetical protein